MARRFEKPLPVGKTGDYSLGVNAEWLGSATLSNVTVTPDSKVTLGQQLVSNNTIKVFLTGASKGLSTVHFEWETSDGRSDCYKTIVEVREC